MQKRTLAVLLTCLGIVATQSVSAEPAPVFDVDAISDQYDPTESEQDLPPPPAPSSRREVFAPQHVASNRDEDWSEAGDAAPTEQRLRRLEKQIDYLQSNASSARVEALQSEVQSMRGQLELLTRKLEKIEANQKTLYADLDKRLSDAVSANQASAVRAEEKSSTKSSAKPKQQTASKKQPNVEEEQEIYQTAYTLIKEKKYNDAVNALHRMLQKYPSGQFASNAHYWLGELYGLMNQNIKAMQEFNVVVRHYPDSPRVSDAQLKIGLIYAADAKWSEAKAAFKKVVNRYPGTSSARLAQEQLKQIRSAGH